MCKDAFAEKVCIAFPHIQHYVILTDVMGEKNKDTIKNYYNKYFLQKWLPLRE